MDSDKTDAIMKWSGFPRPWEKATEVKTNGVNGRTSIVKGITGLSAVLSPGTITEIEAMERQLSWDDWGLVSTVYTLVCRDLAGQNRNVIHDRDTKALPKDFSYEAVVKYYRTPPVKSP